MNDGVDEINEALWITGFDLSPDDFEDFGIIYLDIIDETLEDLEPEGQKFVDAAINMWEFIPVAAVEIADTAVDMGNTVVEVFENTGEFFGDIAVVTSNEVADVAIEIGQAFEDFSQVYDTDPE